MGECLFKGAFPTDSYRIRVFSTVLLTFVTPTFCRNLQIFCLSFQQVSLIITSPFTFYLWQEKNRRSSINKCNNQIYIPQLSLDICSRKRAIHFCTRCWTVQRRLTCNMIRSHCELWKKLVLRDEWKYLLPVKRKADSSHYVWHCGSCGARQTGCWDEISSSYTGTSLSLLHLYSDENNISVYSLIYVVLFPI